jgi:hypothetical protein
MFFIRGEFLGEIKNLANGRRRRTEIYMYGAAGENASFAINDSSGAFCAAEVYGQNVARFRVF